MQRFLILGFAFLAFAFYVMSGGASFDPAASRDALIEARQHREAARIAALPAPGETIAVEGVATTRALPGPATRTNTQAQPLNLASFEDVADPAAELEAAPAGLNVTEEALDRPVPTRIIPETELSLDALETASGARQNIAFAGSTTSASDGRVENTVDIRTVQGSRVNMRSGPGTEYDVIDQLSQSTQVEILTDSGDGWVELRPVTGGATGWIAEFLLSDG